MTPRQQALREARHLIDIGVTDYICFALDRVVDDSPNLEEICATLKAEIGAALDSHVSLSGWLLTQMRTLTSQDRPEPYYSAWVGDGGVAALARLAWIDRMLEDEKH